MADYKIYTLAERPDLEATARHVGGYWAAFMLEDPAANEGRWDHLFREQSHLQVVLCGDQDEVLAMGNSIAVVWDGTVDGLPAGWDETLISSVANHRAGVQPTCVSALSITIRPDMRGKNLSSLVINGLKNAAKTQGFTTMLAPVRPSLKAKYPLTPIENYVRWTQPDGTPFDPWLRVHWRVGARILKIAPHSMTIPGTVADWESWTGMKFPESGRYVIPDALEPITIDVEANRGVYVEPNVWMQHSIA